MAKKKNDPQTRAPAPPYEAKAPRRCCWQKWDRVMAPDRVTPRDLDSLELCGPCRAELETMADAERRRQNEITKARARAWDKIAARTTPETRPPAVSPGFI